MLILGTNMFYSHFCMHFITILCVFLLNSLSYRTIHDTIVVFTAPWCSHCKRLKLIYEQGRHNLPSISVFLTFIRSC